MGHGVTCTRSVPATVCAVRALPCAAPAVMRLEYLPPRPFSLRGVAVMMCLCAIKGPTAGMPRGQSALVAHAIQADDARRKHVFLTLQRGGVYSIKSHNRSVHFISKSMAKNRILDEASLIFTIIFNGLVGSFVKGAKVVAVRGSGLWRG